VTAELISSHCLCRQKKHAHRQRSVSLESRLRYDTGSLCLVPYTSSSQPLREGDC
jgi:hypothetical protein